jgi:hypothetical protein
LSILKAFRRLSYQLQQRRKLLHRLSSQYQRRTKPSSAISKRTSASKQLQRASSFSEQAASASKQLQRKANQFQRKLQMRSSTAGTICSTDCSNSCNPCWQKLYVPVAEPGYQNCRSGLPTAWKGMGGSSSRSGLSKLKGVSLFYD